MVFLYLSHKELKPEKFDANFACLHSVGSRPKMGLVNAVICIPVG